MTTIAANVDAAIVEALSSVAGYTHVGVMAPNPLPPAPFVLCYVVGGAIGDHVVQTTNLHVEVRGDREHVAPIQAKLRSLPGTAVRGVEFVDVWVDVPKLFPDEDTSEYRWQFMAEIIVAADRVEP